MGEKEKAIKIYREMLRISRYDPIAQKNLDRASASNKIKKSQPTQNGQTAQLTTSFIEEPGKTKLVSLVNLAPKGDLLKRNYGDKINLSIRRHTVIVFYPAGTYLRAIHDDTGHRLAFLIIKSVTKNSIVVFLRELSRTKRFKNTPSFPAGNSDYFSFVREEALGHEEKPVVAETGSEDDDEDDSPGKILHADEETEESH